MTELLQLRKSGFKGESPLEHGVAKPVSALRVPSSFSCRKRPLVPPTLHKSPRFRLAVPADLGAIVELRARAISSSQKFPFVSARARHDPKPSLTEFILDRSLLLGKIDGELLFAAALNLDRQEVSEWYFGDRKSSDLWFPSALAAVERMALGFGMYGLNLSVNPSASASFLSQGYRSKRSETETSGSAGTVSLHRSLRRRLDRYGRFILNVFEELGVPKDYGVRHRMARQREATNLRSIGLDIHGREQFMSPGAGTAWRRLVRNALRDGIELQAVSAFRSAGYQADLLRRKLAKGQTMDAILRVSAAPGFSEHHSGRAIDVTTPGFTPLEEDFESSPAFSWLEAHAPKLGFRLSFPRKNRHRLAFEPWHWYYSAGNN